MRPRPPSPERAETLITSLRALKDLSCAAYIRRCKVINAAPMIVCKPLRRDYASCMKAFARIISAQDRYITQQPITNRTVHIMTRWFEALDAGRLDRSFIARHRAILLISRRSPGRIRLSRRPGMHAMVACACFIIACKVTMEECEVSVETEEDQRYMRELGQLHKRMDYFQVLILQTRMQSILRRPELRLCARGVYDYAVPPIDLDAITNLELQILRDLDWAVADPVEADFVYMLVDGAVTQALRTKRLDRVTARMLRCSVPPMCEAARLVRDIQDAGSAATYPDATWSSALRMVSGAIVDLVPQPNAQTTMIAWMCAALRVKLVSPPKRVEAPQGWPTGKPDYEPVLKYSPELAWRARSVSCVLAE